jgi:hypothetical protein
MVIPDGVSNWSASRTWSPEQYPEWWKRPTNAYERQVRTQFWARRVQPLRWSDRNRGRTVLDLRTRFVDQPVSPYQSNAFNVFSGRNAVGFRNPNNTTDYLNPSTGRWLYGVPNSAGGQDWFDPVSGRWIFGAPPSRRPAAPYDPNLAP